MADTSIGLGIIQTIAILTGVVIALIELRHMRESRDRELETRQAQLFMQLYNRWSDPEFAKHYGAARHQYTEDGLEIGRKSVDPFNQDIWLPFHSLGQFFEGMGMLVRKELVNIDYVDELLSYRILWFWEKMKPWFERERILMNNPELYKNIEYLYDEIVKRGYKAKPLIQVLDVEP